MKNQVKITIEIDAVSHLEAADQVLEWLNKQKKECNLPKNTNLFSVSLKKDNK